MKTLKKTLLLVGCLLTSSFAFSQESIVKIKTDKEIGSSISFSVNHCAEALSIDWGDGTFVPFSTKSTEFYNTAEGTVKGKEITIKGNKDWYMFDCSNCELSEINLSAAKALRSLFCQNNHLTTIDLKGMVNLTDLNCSHNQISEFVLTDQNTISKDLKAIENLDISYNEFSGSYIHKMPTLQHLRINNNKYSKFYLNDAGLKSVDCSNNAISGLINVAKSTKLSTFICNGNAISLVNFADKGKEVVSFICADNKIKQINLPSANAMRTLNCLNNNTTTIKLGSASSLNVMDIANNALNFSVLPAKENAPKHLSFEPQQPIDFSKITGILFKENIPYAPIAANWDDRTKTCIDLSNYFVLADGTYDASCQWYSVNETGLESEMTECTTAADGDYTIDNGKMAFFKPQKRAFAKLTSEAYGFVLSTKLLAIGDDITAIENIKSDQHLNVSTTRNAIILSSDNVTEVNIFTIDGKKVWNGNVNGTTSVTLPKGVYIVNNKKIIL